MKATLLVPAALVLALAPAAPAQTVPSATINSYGIYTLVVDSKVVTPGTPSGTSSNVSHISLGEQTERIPMRLGLHFGMECTFYGMPANADVIIQKRVSFPPMSKPDGGQSTGYQRNLDYHTGPDGRCSTYQGYTFDHPYELVPGPWTFTLSYAGQDLVTKTFNVY